MRTDLQNVVTQNSEHLPSLRPAVSTLLFAHITRGTLDVGTPERDGSRLGLLGFSGASGEVEPTLPRAQRGGRVDNENAL